MPGTAKRHRYAKDAVAADLAEITPWSAWGAAMVALTRA